METFFLRHFPDSQSCAFYTVVSKECIPLISQIFFISVKHNLIMEEIVLGMGGFVVFNCSSMSPNVMPLVSSTCFSNRSIGLSVTSLVVVTYSPVYMPTPILGLHTRIPTRAPFEMAVSKTGVFAHQHWI